MICGGLGAGAKNALLQAGIVFYGGVNGNADDAVTSFLTGELNYNPNENAIITSPWRREKMETIIHADMAINIPVGIIKRRKVFLENHFVKKRTGKRD